MSDLVWLIIAVSAFVAGHELLSHPFRAPLVARFGERGFLIVYSLTAFATLGWAGQVWRGMAADRLWMAPMWVHLAAVAVMAFAAILFVGSVTAHFWHQSTRLLVMCEESAHATRASRFFRRCSWAVRLETQCIWAFCRQ